jgi:hypothetical protein
VKILAKEAIEDNSLSINRISELQKIDSSARLSLSQLGAHLLLLQRLRRRFLRREKQQRGSCESSAAEAVVPVAYLLIPSPIEWG